MLRFLLSSPGSGKTTAALMVLEKLRNIVRGRPFGMMVTGVLENSQSSYFQHVADSLIGANSAVDTTELVASLVSALSCGLKEARMNSVLILDNFEVVDPVLDKNFLKALYTAFHTKGIILVVLTQNLEDANKVLQYNGWVRLEGYPHAVEGTPRQRADEKFEDPAWLPFSLNQQQTIECLEKRFREEMNDLDAAKKGQCLTFVSRQEEWNLGVAMKIASTNLGIENTLQNVLYSSSESSDAYHLNGLM